MLVGLSIRDVVLIERHDLQFQNGLCVLTGETGAGKSILLDALGLALGGRASGELVRRGAERASVTAEFDLPASHAAVAWLRDQDLEIEDSLVLRRVVTADGRSRGYVNDQPVGVRLLRELGESLVELHGQRSEQGLLNPANHRLLLDAFGELESQVAQVATTHRTWRQAVSELAEAEERLREARREEEFLRHAHAELDELDPQPGEEEKLAAERAMLMNAGKISEGLHEAEAALGGEDGVEASLNRARRALDRAAEHAAGRLDGAAAALERAAIEATEAIAEIAAAGRDIEHQPDHLSALEERLFALRAAARKHAVSVDELDILRRDFASRLAELDLGESRIAGLRAKAETAATAYRDAAAVLSQSRHRAAKRLEGEIAAELPPLRLDKARFQVAVEDLPESAWSAHGRDRVQFLVATNTGTAPGPLDRIASGGELARFMLALRVVLAGKTAAPTLIFDEVDNGIGGATASAVGERLARLGGDFQVLVITHSPQVAARASHHWQVAKQQDERTTTEVSELDTAGRREEIARMLAGAEVTEAARAAADSLLNASQG